MEWMRRMITSIAHDARVIQVQAGPFLTAVVLERDGRLACGLASTQREEFHPGDRMPVRDAGSMLERRGKELAGLMLGGSLTEVSIGMAAVNALLQLQGDDLRPWMRRDWQNISAEQIICELGRTKNVVLVGHFAFAERIKDRLGALWVLEKSPCQADLPAEAAPAIVPQADVLAMTSMTLINRTFDGLMRYRKPGALTIVLGPGTPLTPLLFDEGVDILAGAIVEKIDTIVPSVAQGATFRQARAWGARFVTLSKNRGL